MQHALNHSARGSWLSLVAETAGVSGATIARVELSVEELHGLDKPRARDSVRRTSKFDESARGFVAQRSLPTLRVVIQVQDAGGEVVGATYWYGNEEDLADGVAVDLGCDFHVSPGSRVIAWIDDQQTVCSARQAFAPQYASEQSFELFQPMKLALQKDCHRAPIESFSQSDHLVRNGATPAEAA